MAHLAADGFILREHGRATFIADYRHALDDSWHFRFLSGEQDTILPVYSHIIDRTLVSESGPWVAALGADETGYARIRRSFNVDDKLLCYSEFYFGQRPVRTDLEATTRSARQCQFQEASAGRVRDHHS